MLNVIQIQDRLKDLSDRQLGEQMQSGTVPQYLVLAEVQRRTKIRQGAQSGSAAPQSTVAEDIVGAGIAALPTEAPTEVPAFASGGIVSFKDGGAPKAEAEARNAKGETLKQVLKRLGISAAFADYPIVESFGDIGWDTGTTSENIGGRAAQITSIVLASPEEQEELRPFLTKIDPDAKPQVGPASVKAKPEDKGAEGSSAPAADAKRYTAPPSAATPREFLPAKKDDRKLVEVTPRPAPSGVAQTAPLPTRASSPVVEPARGLAGLAGAVSSPALASVLAEGGKGKGGAESSAPATRASGSKGKSDKGVASLMSASPRATTESPASTDGGAQLSNEPVFAAAGDYESAPQLIEAASAPSYAMEEIPGVLPPGTYAVDKVNEILKTMQRPPLGGTPEDDNLQGIATLPVQSFGAGGSVTEWDVIKAYNELVKAGRTDDAALLRKSSGAFGKEWPGMKPKDARAYAKEKNITYEGFMGLSPENLQYVLNSNLGAGPRDINRDMLLSAAEARGLTRDPNANYRFSTADLDRIVPLSGKPAPVAAAPAAAPKKTESGLASLASKAAAPTAVAAMELGEPPKGILSQLGDMIIPSAHAADNMRRVGPPSDFTLHRMTDTFLGVPVDRGFVLRPKAGGEDIPISKGDAAQYYPNAFKNGEFVPAPAAAPAAPFSAARWDYIESAGVYANRDTGERIPVEEFNKRAAASPAAKVPKNLKEVYEGKATEPAPPTAAQVAGQAAAQPTTKVVTKPAAFSEMHFIPGAGAPSGTLNGRPYWLSPGESHPAGGVIAAKKEAATPTPTVNVVPRHPAATAPAATAPAAKPDTTGIAGLTEWVNAYEKLAPKRTKYSDVKDRDILAGLEGRIPVREKDNLNMALMKAGFAMMAGNSPYALQNMGAGAMAGLEDYATGKKDIEDLRKEIANAKVAMNKAEYDRDIGDYNAAADRLKFAGELYARMEQIEATKGATAATRDATEFARISAIVQKYDDDISKMLNDPASSGIRSADSKISNDAKAALQAAINARNANSKKIGLPPLDFGRSMQGAGVDPAAVAAAIAGKTKK